MTIPGSYILADIKSLLGVKSHSCQNGTYLLGTSTNVVWEPLQVASGAAELYADEVQQIVSLSHHGTQQLLADLEYFCNVLAALGVALPASLSTWQV